jgi:hypothetical protein
MSEEKEYASLRDEILKWQDRKILISQLAAGVIIAYTGFILNKECFYCGFSWQQASILPLIIGSLAMHTSCFFEFCVMRAATFISVFYKSKWELLIDKAKAENKISRYLGYNRSWALTFLLLILVAVAGFIEKYDTPIWRIDSIIFLIFFITFLFFFYSLWNYDHEGEKRRLVRTWQEAEDALKRSGKQDATTPSSDPSDLSK